MTADINTRDIDTKAGRMSSLKVFLKEPNAYLLKGIQGSRKSTEKSEKSGQRAPFGSNTAPPSTSFEVRISERLVGLPAKGTFEKKTHIIFLINNYNGAFFCINGFRMNLKF